MLSPVGNAVGRFRIDDLLGAGGMGEVYRGYDEQAGRAVAIKMLGERAEGAKFLERLRNEARIHVGLYHSNIATLFEVAETPRGPCLVMEYVPGVDLAEWLDRHGPFHWEEGMRLFREIVRAVAYLHANGVVHRDIKPHNVKLTPDHRIKLLDFGIAKDEGSAALTATGAVVGTLQYMAPEQLAGSAADARSDVWALGVLFHEMLTGRPPFQAETVSDLIRQANGGGYACLRSFDPFLPEECDAVVARCLKRRPSQRFQNAGEVARCLDSMLEGTGSSPASLPGAVLGWFRALPDRLRGRPLVLAGTALTAVAALGSAGWMAFGPGLGGPTDPVARMVAALPNIPRDTVERSARAYLDLSPHRALAVAPQRRSTFRGGAYASAPEAEEGILEGCQLHHNEPCFLLAVGDEIRIPRRGVGWAPRPMPRVEYRGPYDPERVPGLRPAQRSRPEVANYARAAEPKAMALNSLGAVFPAIGVRSGQRAAEVQALGDCNAWARNSGRGGLCLLYATGNRVVLPERRTAPGGVGQLPRGPGPQQAEVRINALSAPIDVYRDGKPLGRVNPGQPLIFTEQVGATMTLTVRFSDGRPERVTPFTVGPVNRYDF